MGRVKQPKIPNSKRCNVTELPDGSFEISGRISSFLYARSKEWGVRPADIMDELLTQWIAIQRFCAPAKGRKQTAEEVAKMLLDRHCDQNSALMDITAKFLTAEQRASITEQWELVVDQKGWGDWRRWKGLPKGSAADTDDEEEDASEDWNDPK